MLRTVLVFFYNNAYHLLFTLNLIRTTMQQIRKCTSLYALVDAYAILGNRTSYVQRYVHTLSPWKERWLACFPGPMNVTIRRFCHSNVPVSNTDLGPKQLLVCMINKWQFCAAKLAKSANYASSALFWKSMKSILVLVNYAKNYTSTIYQSQLSDEPWDLLCRLLKTTFVGSKRGDYRTDKIASTCHLQ